MGEATRHELGATVTVRVTGSPPARMQALTPVMKEAAETISRKLGHDSL